MDQLSDDVLLEVLHCLSAEDLLTLRLVSKRLGRLALDPQVWRRKYVYHETRYAHKESTSCAVLRLAPCLRVLSFPTYSLRPSVNNCQHLYTTRCAVKSLHLTIEDFDSSVGAAMVIQHQESLGRLRIVRAGTPPFFFGDDFNVSIFIGILAFTRGLEELQFTYGKCTSFSIHIPIGAIGTVPSTLRKFTCYSTDDGGTYLDVFVNHILATHGATLNNVNLSSLATTSTTTADLLAGMPNLCALSCGPLLGLEALKACRSLRTLNLWSKRDSSEQQTQSAATLLRDAHQLREVEVAGSGDFCALLVLALGLSGVAPVERLIITLDWNGEPCVPALVRALPRLPALRELCLPSALVKFDDVLRGISLVAAPVLPLQRLELYNGCIHDWVHTDAARAFLSANPSLHVVFNICEACKRDWIQPTNGKSVYQAILFTHPESECPFPGYHWPHLAEIHISWNVTVTSKIRYVSV